MKILYFDCFSGISGDMTIGALLDLGIDTEKFKNELAKLNLDGYDIEISKVVKSGITGTDFKVILHDDEHEKHGSNEYMQMREHGVGNYANEHLHLHVGHEHQHGLGHEIGHDHDHGHNHDHEHGKDCEHDHGTEHGHEIEHNHGHECGHEHQHVHDYEIEHNHEHEHKNERNHNHEHWHNHEHAHCHDHAHDHDGHSHEHSARNLADIEKLIDESSLSERVKSFSKKVFREIAAAEAKVHGKGIYEVHFHEVGAVDSIVDIVGAAICLDMLGIDKVFSSPLHEGRGFVKCQHGVLPVPVPAVMEMLSGSNIPIVTEDVDTELVTPTGMAIIKCLASGYGKMPEVRIEKAGYGMGKKDTGRFNALRVVLGTIDEEESGDNKTKSRDLGENTSNCGSNELCNAKYDDEVVLLETNIDDMSPELLGYTMEKLFEKGALDVFYTPVYMKKNRPGVMLTVLTDAGNEQKLVDVILTETSTLGIRRTAAGRYVMNREWKTVSTEYGEARVKVSSKGGIKKYAPEYEDCRKLAQKTGKPLMEIYNAVNLCLGDMENK